MCKEKESPRSKLYKVPGSLIKSVSRSKIWQPEERREILSNVRRRRTGGQGRALAGVEEEEWNKAGRLVRRSEEVRPHRPEPDKTNRTNRSRDERQIRRVRG